MVELTTQHDLLHPNLFWSKPLNRNHAGRLLAAGGQRRKFSAIQQFFELSNAAGIGQCRLVLPDTLRKLIGEVPGITYGPSTPAGSLAKAARATITEQANQSDAVMLGLDWGNNSESTMLLEACVLKLGRPLILMARDLATLYLRPNQLHTEVLIMGDMRDLFKLARKWRVPLQVKSTEALGRAAILEQLAETVPADYWVWGPETLIYSRGRASLTPAAGAPTTLAAALAGTFWVQYPGQRFEALSNAAYIQGQVMSESPQSAKELSISIRKNLEKYE